MFRFLTSQNGQLGTFLGVFLPSSLMILGTILYLRLGLVTGMLGLGGVLAIVVFANFLSITTSASMSSISTNSKVGVGGPYFVISRSLGLEIGGAIGVALFLSQALSASLYAYGAAETMRLFWPSANVPVLAAVSLVLMALLAFTGAKRALQAQIPILILVVASVLCLFVGALNYEVSGVVEVDGIPSIGFWEAFGVLFAMVTGFTAGSSLSGLLADPKKSIPRGTIASVFVSFAIYLAVPTILYFSVPRSILANSPLIWVDVSFGGAWIVVPAMLGAIFSSGVASLLAAPETLRALAIDGMVSKVFNSAPAKNRMSPAFVTSVVIASCAILLGGLNPVAKLVTMVFLAVYGTINLAVFLEEISTNPSWRPSFKVHWLISLLGAIGCVVAMFLVDARYGMAALIAEFGLWLYLARTERVAEWGDVRRDICETFIAKALRYLSTRPISARNWRPNIMVFTENALEKISIINFAGQMGKGEGVVSVCEVAVGDSVAHKETPIERRRELADKFKQAGISAFPRVLVSDSLEAGILSSVQSAGFGDMSVNTVMMGWPETPERLAELLRMNRRLDILKKSLIIGRIPNVSPFNQGRDTTIQIWWGGGLKRDGDLLLLLAHLLTRSPEWRNAKVEIICLASSDLMKGHNEVLLSSLLPEIRINAEVIVRQVEPGVSVREMVAEESERADLVMFSLGQPEPGAEKEHAKKLFETTEGLVSFLYVNNASIFDGDLVTAGVEERPGISKMQGLSSSNDVEVESSK